MMVDQFKDEVSQDIYCSIDLGRTMKMLFGGQILLTFATLCKTSNSLAKSMICCKMWKLNSKNRILNVFTNLSKISIRQRSLLVIFTNFDSVNAMHRNLP
jgi:hypothetical protein